MSSMCLVPVEVLRVEVVLGGHPAHVDHTRVLSREHPEESIEIAM
jgi:hypothetical protein